MDFSLLFLFFKEKFNNHSLAQDPSLTQWTTQLVLVLNWACVVQTLLSLSHQLFISFWKYKVVKTLMKIFMKPQSKATKRSWFRSPLILISWLFAIIFQYCARQCMVFGGCSLGRAGKRSLMCPLLCLLICGINLTMFYLARRHWQHEVIISCVTKQIGVREIISCASSVPNHFVK